ncbi:MAG TPA: Slp family lipoprotein [Acidiferrobacterales bacterium]|nr:Slp family lipoprotein [Acidiferrobacterales bacterium]
MILGILTSLIACQGRPGAIRFLTGFTLLGLLLTACATNPKWDIRGVDKNITPAKAVTDIQATRGRIAQWGGVIIGAQNLKDATQLEVLAYPLDEAGRPKQGTAPLGRFLALKNGYLETVDWAAGRLATFIGPVQDARAGAIGETNYTYPVLTVQQSYLWPKTSNNTEPRFHFGIGIGLHN